MYNLLVKYFTEILGDEANLEKRYSENSDNIYKNIGALIEQSMYNKLNTIEPILDPEKVPKDIDLLKDILKKSLELKFSISLENVGQENVQEIDRMIDFYLNISDNISVYIYTEIIRLFDNMKKISMMIKIYNIINPPTNPPTNP